MRTTPAKTAATTAATRTLPALRPGRAHAVGRAALTSLLTLCLSAPATAQPPAKPELAGLSGALPTAPARMTFWGFELYDARLWTQTGFEPGRFAAHSFALELAYLRRLDGPAIARRSLDEMRRVGSFSEGQAQTWLAQMRELFPDVRAGDRITGVHRAGEGAEFWFNGQRRGRVADPRFAELFFGIWLHPNTSAPDLRERLLASLP